MPLLVLLLAFLLASPASAAFPVPHRSYQAHDHVTPGKQWHVQLDASGRSDRLLGLVIVYAQQCGVTVAKRNVPVFEDGTVHARGALRGGGGWQVDAQFVSPDVLQGS